MGKTIEELLEEDLVRVEEQTYEVPDNWVWTTIGAIIDVKSSKRIFASEYVNVGVPFYRSTEVIELSKNNTTSSQYFISRDKYEEIKEKYGVPQPGDILLTSVGSIGNSWIVDEREFYYKDGNVTQLCNNIKVNMKYVNSFISSPLFKLQVSSTVSGSAYNALTIVKIKSLKMPLPPLSEQQRIVTKIESLFSKIDKAKELIEETREGFEDRKSAILAKAYRGELTRMWREENLLIMTKELLTETVRITDNEYLKKFNKLPTSWEWVQIKDIIYEMQTKKPSSIDKDFFYYIDIDSIDNKNQQIREMKRVEVDKAPSRASRHVEKGDVVISLVRPYLKNIALVEYDQNDMIASTGFYVCKTKSIYESKLLYYYLKSEGFTNLLTSLMRGDNSPSVRISEFPEQLIPLPPLEEQKEIVRILDNLLSFESKIEELTGLEGQIELLKKSILAKAFRGELGTNDPTEESATQLLKEVLSQK